MELVDRFGFSACYNNVKRFVQGLRRVNTEQFDHLEFAPVEVAQAEYGEGAPHLAVSRSLLWPLASGGSAALAPILSGRRRRGASVPPRDLFTREQAGAVFQAGARLEDRAVT